MKVWRGRPKAEADFQKASQLQMIKIKISKNKEILEKFIDNG